MKRSFFPLALLCTLLTGSLLAQSNSLFIGGSAGLNLSRLKYTEDLSELYSITNSTLGLNGGFNVGVKLQKFTLSTGLHYVQRGGEYQTDNFTDDIGTGFFSAKERTHFLSVPILVGYEDYFGDNIGFSFRMGPSVNIGLGGNLDEITEYFGESETVEDNYKLQYGSGVNEDYKGTQTGFQLSPGLFFEVNRNSRINFNVTWDIGLGDNFNPRYKNANEFFKTNSGNQLNRTAMFTIGYEYHFHFADKY